MAKQLSPARKIALKTLISARENDAFPTEIVHTICERNNLSAEDKGFCVKLVRGVAGHTICLDHVLDQFINSKVSPSVRDALRISAFELLYLKKDAHAAVSQGVELVRSVAKNAAGLANAVLRKVSDIELPQNEALRAGFPKWLGDYVKENCDSNFISLCEEEPKLQFVNNSLNPPMVAMNAPIEEAQVGRVIIADASAQAIAEAVANFSKKSQAKTLLEVGAGRGTKTALIESHLANLGYSLGSHDVLDNSKRRLGALKAKAKVCKFNVDNIFCEDATSVNLNKNYDVIFIDSPCTGLGTLRRHPEIKSRVTYEEVQKSGELSLQILKNCSQFTERQGHIFYSTCTITHEENEDVINDFLQSGEGKNFTLENIVREAKLTSDSDAHFCVCLERK